MGGADTVRKKMEERGAEVHDQLHMFTFGDLDGSYCLRTGLQMKEIRLVCLEREEEKQTGNLVSADQLQAWLTKQGVRLDESTKTFFLPDGTTASFDPATVS